MGTNPLMPSWSRAVLTAEAHRFVMPTARFFLDTSRPWTLRACFSESNLRRGGIFVYLKRYIIFNVSRILGREAAEVIVAITFHSNFV
jgi:hypothetical protein